MKKTRQQAKRIINNIFDLINNTVYAVDAIKEMQKDLKGKNITVDTDKNIILIQDEKAQITQYTISII